ncbi:hypothetical protein DV736_g4763, partial [Chaetothyriales sp. CBS 134916]
MDTIDTTAPLPPLPYRFTLELEFVLCLSNPYYLSHLASTYPHLLNPPSTSTAANGAPTVPDDDTPASCFARYLAYLYSYWKTPQYSQYLTHPGSTLRSLELLQSEEFRKDVIRPDVIERLLRTQPESLGGETGGG